MTIALDLRYISARTYTLIQTSLLDKFFSGAIANVRLRKVDLVVCIGSLSQAGRIVNNQAGAKIEDCISALPYP